VAVGTVFTVCLVLTVGFMLAGGTGRAVAIRALGPVAVGAAFAICLVFAVRLALAVGAAFAFGLEINSFGPGLSVACSFSGSKFTPVFGKSVHGNQVAMTHVIISG
jgi:hypothetical protein